MVKKPLLTLLFDLAASQRIVMLVHREDVSHGVFEDTKIKVERFANGLR